MDLKRVDLLLTAAGSVLGIVGLIFEETRPGRVLLVLGGFAFAASWILHLSLSGKKQKPPS